jgi:hypothetical protein
MVGMRDGHRNDCKQCNLAMQAARHRSDPQPKRDRAKQWKRDNPERDAARQAAYRASGRKSISDRKSYLKRKYGMTLAEYERILASQGGVCALCRRPPRPGISLHVDHEHTSNRIRGLLCFQCNNALGDIEDNLAWLDAARYYLVGPLRRDPLVERRLEELRRMPRAWEAA